MPKPDLFLPAPRAAQLLKCSIRTLARYVQAGDIEARKDERGRNIVSGADVEKIRTSGAPPSVKQAELTITRHPLPALLPAPMIPVATPPASLPYWVNSTEAARLSGLPKRLLLQLARSGELAAVPVGRSFRFQRRMLRDWLPAKR